jgi:hypothetical protein
MKKSEIYCLAVTHFWITADLALGGPLLALIHPLHPFNHSTGSNKINIDITSSSNPYPSSSLAPSLSIQMSRKSCANSVSTRGVRSLMGTGQGHSAG